MEKQITGANDDISDDEIYLKKKQDKELAKSDAIEDELRKSKETSALIRSNNQTKKLAYKANYPEIYEKLDKQIDLIEDKIFQIWSFPDIAKLVGTTGITLAKWFKQSKLKDRIDDAFSMSAETRMQESLNTLTDAISDPTITGAQAMLIRELAASQSRIAGFRDPKTFTNYKKSEDMITSRQIVVVDDNMMDKMIEEMKNLKKVEASSFVNSDDDEYDEAEEIVDEE